MLSKLKYFTRAELTLWGCSVLLIVGSFVLFHQTDYLTLTASLIGATSLILNAKGNPAGQVLTIAFSLLYGYISLTCAYYGEMITYLGMTAPMAVFALITWLRNPYRGNKAQVMVNRIPRRELLWMILPTVAVTVAFWFILRAFHTTNLVPSTVSVTTSFVAVYLTFRRSAWFPLAYAANDVVLIVLWSLASAEDLSYLSVLICFVMFLANDLYGFFSWRKMQKKQADPA